MTSVRLAPEVGGSPGADDAGLVGVVQYDSDDPAIPGKTASAWVVVARDPEAGRVLPRELRTREEKFLPAMDLAAAAAEPGASRWSA